MKKTLLFISIIGLFALASCGTKKPNNVSTNSNQPSTQNNQSQSIDSSTNSKNNITTTNGTKTDDIESYNDDGWKGSIF